MNFAKFIRIIGVVTLSMMLFAGAGHSSTSAHVTTATLATLAEAPQAILTGFSPLGLVRNDTHLFVAGGGYSLESCQLDPTQSMVVLERVNFDGGGSVPLLSRCAFFLSGMVADHAYLYIRDSDNKIKRLPVGGGALEILVEDASTCCGLAMDDTHLYWARRESSSSNNGIFRVLKTGGAIEQVVSVTSSSNTYFIRDLAVDATHLFWIEGKQGISAIDQPGVGAGNVSRHG